MYKEKYYKSKEELEALKAEFENLSNKLKDLTEDEVEEIVGGFKDNIIFDNNSFMDELKNAKISLPIIKTRSNSRFRHKGRDMISISE